MGRLWQGRQNGSLKSPYDSWEEPMDPSASELVCLRLELLFFGSTSGADFKKVRIPETQYSVLGLVRRSKTLERIFLGQASVNL